MGRNELELDNSRCCNILLPLLRTGFLLFVLFSKPLFVYDSVLCIITYWRAKTRLFFIFIEETAATKRDLKLNFVSSALDDDMDRIYIIELMISNVKLNLRWDAYRETSGWKLMIRHCTTERIDDRLFSFLLCFFFFQILFIYRVLSRKKGE